MTRIIFAALVLAIFGVLSVLAYGASDFGGPTMINPKGDRP